ncbi:MAG TPA: hypothetical protein VKU90_00965 [Caulobacteraceae bacterium]|nr:hypothetical protein [Caulobacteraceae bacterium]
MAFWSLNHQSETAPAATVDATTYKAELQHAYDRGRLEARPRRRAVGFGGVAALLTFLLAALAVIFIVVAVQQGSFQAGGALIDQTLGRLSGGRIASQPAAAPTAAVASNALAGATPSAVVPGPAKPVAKKTGGTSD